MSLILKIFNIFLCAIIILMMCLFESFFFLSFLGGFLLAVCFGIVFLAYLLSGKIKLVKLFLFKYFFLQICGFLFMLTAPFFNSAFGNNFRRAWYLGVFPLSEFFSYFFSVLTFVLFIMLVFFAATYNHPERDEHKKLISISDFVLILSASAMIPSVWFLQAIWTTR